MVLYCVKAHGAREIDTREFGRGWLSDPALINSLFTLPIVLLFLMQPRKIDHLKLNGIVYINYSIPHREKNKY